MSKIVVSTPSLCAFREISVGDHFVVNLHGKERLAVKCGASDAIAVKTSEHPYQPIYLSLDHSVMRVRMIEVTL